MEPLNTQLFKVADARGGVTYTYVNPEDGAVRYVPDRAGARADVYRNGQTMDPNSGARFVLDAQAPEFVPRSYDERQRFATGHHYEPPYDERQRPDTATQLATPVNPSPDASLLPPSSRGHQAAG